MDRPLEVFPRAAVLTMVGEGESLIEFCSVLVRGQADLPFLLSGGCKDVVITERSVSFNPTGKLVPAHLAVPFSWDSSLSLRFKPAASHNFYLFRERENVVYRKFKLCGSLHSWSWCGCFLEMEMLYNRASAVCPVPQLFSGTRISCKVEPATD